MKNDSRSNAERYSAAASSVSNTVPVRAHPRSNAPSGVGDYVRGRTPGERAAAISGKLLRMNFGSQDDKRQRMLAISQEIAAADAWKDEIGGQEFPDAAQRRDRDLQSMDLGGILIAKQEQEASDRKEFDHWFASNPLFKKPQENKPNWQWEDELNKKHNAKGTIRIVRPGSVADQQCQEENMILLPDEQVTDLYGSSNFVVYRKAQKMTQTKPSLEELNKRNAELDLDIKQIKLGTAAIKKGTAVPLSNKDLHIRTQSLQRQVDGASSKGASRPEYKLEGTKTQRGQWKWRVSDAHNGDRLDKLEDKSDAQ